MSETFYKSVKVNKLFDWFDRRCLAVPDIQREFVWNAQRACALLDSIYKGYPIGTVMIWRTDKSNIWMLRHNLHMLPPFDQNQNKEIFFLIDGQQRLSVLFQVRRGESIKNSNDREIRFGDICFSTDGGEQRFLYLRQPDPEKHFKVSSILSASNWRKSFRGLWKYQLKEIEECRRRLLNYQLFLIFFRTKEQADVRETFIRINAQGMRITEADKAFSVAIKVKPLHRFHHLCENLQCGYKALDKAVYWTTLVLIRGLKELGQKAFTRLTKEIDRTEKGRLWFKRNEPKVAESIKLACDYLVHHLKVFDFRLLPYENMIAVLAVFFYWNNQAQPNKIQKEQIRRWFWHTAVLQRYAGIGYRPNILGDEEFFRRLGQSRRGRYEITEKASLQSIRLADYRKGSALSRAFRLLLIHNKPCYVTNGEPIPIGTVAAAINKKDLHHIFPKDKLKCAGVPQKQCNTLCNICYLVAHDNRSFGSRLPYRYLGEFRNKKHFARVMRSHLIPYEDDSPLWNNQAKKAFRNFIDARLKILKQGFNKVAGAKLFE